MLNFITFGMKIKLKYFLSSSHFPNTSSFQLSFFGGITTGLTFSMGPVANAITSRYGVKFPLLCGSLLVVLGLELASLAAEFWQLFLTEGVMVGLGYSLLFIPSIGIPSQWFLKRRALATGIATAGSGLGGLVLSPIVQILLVNVGAAWCFQIMGFLSLLICLGATALIKSHPDAMVVEYKIFDINLLKHRGFQFQLIFSFINLFGYIIPFFYVPATLTSSPPAYAEKIGLPPSTGALFVGILSRINAAGRILCGQAADMWGPINAMIAVVFASGISCLVIWMFANSYAVLLLFVIAYGLTGGAFWALTPPVTAQVVSFTKLGSGLSIIYLFNVIPLIFSSPIASALTVNFSPSLPYEYTILFAGLTLCFGASLLLGAALSKKN
ncbi:major facilitator superfamily domain-containing protein [Jimgerdemannia flammicorona]|uniref:Major facilitator superfamily domain-containing protein n=1 Tax=Jimgerdemannia flammicorona TaxID=994334 RepID=A0A433QLH6_9FUNG|nr:major facilitator superfamily domain-containing protein [Jimgerdemannia flammicorona]